MEQILSSFMKSDKKLFLESTVMNIPDTEQHKNERLSVFIDAQQSESEISQVVDDLLNEPDLKNRYIRMQLVNDSLHGQIEHQVLSDIIPHRVSLALEELPVHCVDDALQLQAIRTENITQTNWFQNFFKNKMVSGISVAASVMFVTLMTLQIFDIESNAPSQTSLATLVPENVPTTSERIHQQSPSIQVSSELPATLVSSAVVSVNNKKQKQQYQWIEADPELSRQVREYISEHETHRAAYSLQPKIRAATYQVSE